LGRRRRSFPGFQQVEAGGARHGRHWRVGKGRHFVQQSFQRPSRCHGAGLIALLLDVVGDVVLQQLAHSEHFGVRRRDGRLALLALERLRIDALGALGA
jgi:hypothetical protein